MRHPCLLYTSVEFALEGVVRHAANDLFRKVSGVVFRIAFEDGFENDAPVSYTHLDVYKRQGLEGSQMERTTCSQYPGEKTRAYPKTFNDLDLKMACVPSCSPAF